MTRPNLIRRLQAVFRGQGSEGGLLPAQQQSERMPDLERWTMPHRSVDMTDWEVAKNMATNVHRPDRARLMDLYDSILVDAHLASAMESRVLRVVRSKYRLVKNGEPQPRLLPLLQRPWFEDLLQYVAEAPFRGHTLIELGELTRPGELRRVNRIDPRNVLPWSGVVVRRQGEETGYPFREAPLNAYLLEVGRAEDLGLLAEVAPVAIVKKYAVGSWSDYVHKFGIPPRWVRTSSRSAHRIKQLEEMMQRMLSSAYGVIEGDEEIQVMQTPGTDAHKVFDELIARMNSEISKRLLGQDGTSDNKDASGTYGSLKVLQGVAEDRHQADKAAAAYVVNNELFPRLTALGYPFTGVRFEWDEFQDMAPTELVDAVSKLGLVFDIDPDFVAERTGIKILGARRMPGELGSQGSGRQGGGQPPKPKEPGDEDAEEDGGGITALYRAPELLDCGCPAVHHITAEAPIILDQVVDDLLQAAYEGKDWHNPYMEAVGKVYQEGLLKTWKNDMAHLEYSAPDHAAAAAMEINVFQFSAAKTTAALVDLNAMAREGGTFQEFRRRVDTSGVLDKYNKHTLETEWHMAVNTGVQSSRYFRQVADSDALPFWEYVTQEDGRVRPAHAALNGKVFKADDPIWSRIYPPNGWRCRCYVQPRYDAPDGTLTEEQGIALMRGSDPKGYAAMEKGGFLVNRSQESVVFDLNLAYREKLQQTEVGKRRMDKGFIFGVNKSYGRKGMDHATLKAAGLPSRGVGLSSKQAALDWFDTHAMHPLGKDQSGERVLVMTDHSGRKIHLTRAHFEGHMDDEGTPGHRTDRHEVAHLIPDILKNPDEVWIERGEQAGDAAMRYVRLTDEKILSVTVRAKGGRLEVATWTGDLDEKQRQGLLIKRYK